MSGYGSYQPPGGGGPGSGRYSSDRPDPRSGQAAPPPQPRPTIAEVARELERVGAAARNGRYGKEGRQVQLNVNCYPTDLSDLPDLVRHYDIVFEAIEEDQKPLPVGIATKLIRDIEANYAHDFRNSKIAHDGRKNAYLNVDPGWSTKTFQAEREGTKYNVKFNMANMVPTKDLVKYINKEDPKCPHEAVALLDTVLRTSPLRNFVYTGKAFGIPPDLDTVSSMRLGDGCEAWVCYYQAFRPHDTGMFLAFDVTYSAFYISQTVYDFAAEILGTPTDRGDTDAMQPAFTTKLTTDQTRRLENAIRGLKIIQNYQPVQEQKPLTVKRITPEAASELAFEDPNSSRRVSIADHFADMGQALNYPYLPCLDIQSGKTGHTYIPLEKATFMTGQRRQKQMNQEMKERMANIGARSPSARLAQIASVLDDVNKQTQEYLQAFGVKVNIDRLAVPARIMDPPLVQLGKNVTIDVRQNPNNEFHWTMKNNTFYQTGEPLVSWGVLVIANDIVKYEVQRFIASVRHVCEQVGMKTEAPEIGWSHTPILQKGMMELHGRINSNPKYGGKKCQIIMVIKNDTATRDYNQIKNVGDTYLGIPTQCVVMANAKSPKELYCLNLVLKINAKLNGVNHRIPGDNFSALGKSFMVIGASVSHASGLESKGDSPSVSAVVGSLDKRCGRQVGTFRVQDAKAEGIQDFGAMVREVVHNFASREEFLPDNILIYRNGVADGQFAKVLSDELGPIRDELNKLGPTLKMGPYNPKISFIVMQRGHHVRFEPIDDSLRDLSGNCLPGTVVDSQVAHPTNFDFYLFSHNGIKGTSRPMRYTVLMDDINFTPDEIQGLTYRLCYLFARSTRSVSIVPPVYYADLLAVRGRAYLSARNPSRFEVRPDQPQMPLAQDSPLPTEYATGIPKLHENLAGTLYYV
ncbi:Protein argonaute 2 (translation initiation factor eIF2C 2) [Chondrus crispus]|uniref:Protein argonaute 2 (Translation initiation factor eIF2C 2) n=1 Tax=Chondrus crispus TaxID=2769 RepID=R7QNI5_CHOCR|nr:Protein argonaute 2 (translation initiation factor eIF2C 2) [Chondrus crispus]CDF38945.1 Protein argonaute 2 (translation initiation factor eIF2C 2) [Chondrus crispus]|eukprot:XP_005718850.1 Protein argonaute 2 (translation initiation factor eIF2C 2) [Chondrus crispus]